jgi:hypothetical protein
MGEGLIVANSKVKFHPSYLAAEVLFRSWEEQAVTPPNDPIALHAIATAKASLKRSITRDRQRLIAQAWGVSPGGARRNVLRAAGLNPERWDEPIHSFTDAERIALRAAALAAVRVFERILNAI